MSRMIDEVETLVKKDKTVMKQSTISEEVRLGNEALKNRVIAYWRAHPELNSVELPIANLAYHVFEKPIKDYNCFYTLSTGLILQGSKRVNVDGKRWEYGRCTWISTAADTPSSYEILVDGDARHHRLLHAAFQAPGEARADLRESAAHRARDHISAADESSGRRVDPLLYAKQHR